MPKEKDVGFVKYYALGTKKKEHKVRATALLDSKHVYTLNGGSVVCATAEAVAYQEDGTKVKRPKIQKPPGWVTAKNFAKSKKGF